MSWVKGPTRYTVVHSAAAAVLFVDTGPVDAIVFHRDLPGSDDPKSFSAWHRGSRAGHRQRSDEESRPLALSPWEPTGESRGRCLPQKVPAIPACKRTGSRAGKATARGPRGSITVGREEILSRVS